MSRSNPRFVHLLTFAGLTAAMGAAVLAHRPPQNSGTPEPAGMKVDYKPGAYFPPGFPLHGRLRLLTAPQAEMGQRTRIRLEYTVGDLPIESGMTLEIWKHFTSDVEAFQVTNPREPAYFGAEFTGAGIQFTPEAHTNWVQRNTPSVFPYRKAAGVRIHQGRLKAGDKVYFDLGGERGVRMQHYEENLFNFRLAIIRENKLVGYAGDAILRITGGPMRRLRVQAPSIVKAGEAFAVEVVPQDEWGSLARDAAGLTLRVTSPGVTGAAFEYDADLKHYIARAARAAKEGVLRIEVQAAGGERKGISNPVWVERDPARQLYYGDLHQHTYLADGRGVFEELYLYGRRVGLLDFGAVTPHHAPMSVTGPILLTGTNYPADAWPALQRATRLFNGWKGFVSILGYEYSVGTERGGHHNVFFNADEARSTMEIDRSDPMAPIGKMLRTLELVRKPALVIPHIGGGPPDWSHPTDPRVERLFEIASVHGVFEESYQKHLKSGQRLAASASGDTHTTSMGNAYPGLIYVMSNGLTGVYAHGKSRQQIWDGLYQRRTFGVSGNQRILLDFRVNGEPMGGELPSAASVRLEARISGVTPIVRVDFLRNSRVIHSVTPVRNRGSILRVVWGDNLYQRRAAVGMRHGEVRPSAGRLALIEPVHRDQAFEEIAQQGDGIRWYAAAVSNDRDGFLADISGLTGDLTFKLEDADGFGAIEARIPLTELKREGYFAWKKEGGPRHPYMEKMGVKPAFFLECELVDAAGTRDVELSYEDREPPKSGDYWYVRVEQLDTNKAWSSPVWNN
jgi:hypothetical protein